MAAHVRALADDLGVPLGSVLEGGYDLGALSSSVAATLETFANGAEPEVFAPEGVTAHAIEVIGRYWPVRL